MKCHRSACVLEHDNCVHTQTDSSTKDWGITTMIKYIIVSYHAYGDDIHAYYTGFGWSPEKEKAALYHSEFICDQITGGLKQKLGRPAYIGTIRI